MHLKMGTENQITEVTCFKHQVLCSCHEHLKISDLLVEVCGEDSKSHFTVSQSEFVHQNYCAIYII